MNKVNSIIFKNSENDSPLDYSNIGINYVHGTKMTIEQEKHFLRVGDAIYYDTSKKMFLQARAKNTIESEVCGIVDYVFTNNKFSFVTKGMVKTDKYKFPVGTTLYLSSTSDGKLVSIKPNDVVIKIGTQMKDGIIVNIQRGFKQEKEDETETLEPYTEEEINEIILNVNVW
jgi:hypothetical protein